jgi:hypothetical protein
LTPQIEQEATKFFGDKVELVQQARDKEAIKVTRVQSTPNLVKTSSPVGGGKKDPTAQTFGTTAVVGPPLIDSEPYIGGDRMWREVFRDGGTFVFECTAGGEWNNGSSVMATAGHCQKTNYSWYQGYYDQPNNALYYSGGIGTVFVNAFIQNGSDSQLLEGATYLAEVWLSSGGTEYGAARASAVALAVEGQPVCLDGSFSGTQCSGVVTIPDQCSVVEGLDPDTGVIVAPTMCNQTRIHSTTAVISQQGDSGGPAFLDLGTSGVAMLGVISAENDGGYTGVYANRTGMQANFVGDFATF